MLTVPYFSSCSYVFWMGDLNFRLEDLTYEGAIRHIEKGNLTKLLTYDQVPCLSRQASIILLAALSVDFVLTFELKVCLFI